MNITNKKAANELDTLLKQPAAIEFSSVMALIDEHYDFSPTAFTNGDTQNKAGENNGSCKLFAFATLHKLDQTQTLALFGEHYRSIVNTPDGRDHQNIRNFQARGWGGIEFAAEPLQAK